MATRASNRPGKEIIRAKLEKRSVGEISDFLDVDPAHIYNVERRGVSPTLYGALVDAGWVEDTRRCKANGHLRRAAWLTAAEAQRFDAQRKRAGATVADILLEWTERRESE